MNSYKELSCQLGLNHNSIVPHGLQVAALISDWGSSDVTSYLSVITLTVIHSLHGMHKKAHRNVLKIYCSNYEINKRSQEHRAFGGELLLCEGLLDEKWQLDQINHCQHLNVLNSLAKKDQNLPDQ